MVETRVLLLYLALVAQRVDFAATMHAVDAPSPPVGAQDALSVDTLITISPADEMHALWFRVHAWCAGTRTSLLGR
jgi:hypothetical protein